MIYRIHVAASKAGSIGAKYNINRYYNIEAPDSDTAQDLAREKAYSEGLEHTLTRIIVGGDPNP